MRTHALLLAVLLALPARPALAQGPEERIAQLEAENAVLKVEVRALRSRIEAVEEILRAKLGTAPTEALPPTPAAVPPAPPHLSADETSLMVESLATDGLGAETPEELARAIFAALADGPAQQSGLEAGIISRFSVFGLGPNPTLLDDMWGKVWRPKDMKGAPSGAELLEVLEVMRPPIREAAARFAEVSIRSSVPNGPLFQADVALTPSRLGALHLTGIRVNGRCFAAHIHAEWIEMYACGVLTEIRRVEGDSGPRAGSFEELAKRGCALGSFQAEGPRMVRIPFYRVELRMLERGEYGAIATPDAPDYASFVLGPIPGEFDPLKNPYEVRKRVGR